MFIGHHHIITHKKVEWNLPYDSVAGAAEGQHPRHVDLIWPLWNMFDLTPDGRGADWFPKTSYG